LKSDGDLVEVLRATREADAEAVYVVSSRQTNLLVGKLVAFAATNRLPLVGGWGAWARAGGLLSYGPNLDDMVRIAATYVDKIIKGAHPTELPVQQPTRFELVINLKTAKTLGLTVPQSLLAHADKVID
jgi:putative ABC transport system substrate-binding protein